MRYRLLTTGPVVLLITPLPVKGGMMKIRIMLVLGLLVLSTGLAQAITLHWQALPGVITYRIYYGVRPGQYDTRLEVGSSTSAVISGLTPGQTYYFTVTADNGARESEDSAEIVVVIPPSDAPVP
jgi:hypothetical protein